ncbi:hypothetical protein ACS9SB_0022020 [Bacillus subtilis]|uniref:hypothetical protein n=1 Tax=Bacillus cabrialesii TaxID=2487276 RepID=UPI003CF874BA
MTDHFLEAMNDMEKLQIMIFERNAELCMCKAFLKEKGLEKEYEKRITEAKAIVESVDKLAKQ